MRARATAAAAGTAAALLLAGCSSGSTSPTAGGSPDPSAAAQAAKVGWSPCDALTAAEVSRYAGEPVEEQNGTDSEPRCTFTPKAKGGAAYDVSYLWFDGGLDAALDAMGGAAQQLRKVDVPGADSARLAVNARRSGIAVTGFVQTRGLVQSVNAARIAPYDESTIVTATKRLMAALARKAPDPS